MKSCAKHRGVPTAKLLDMVHGHKETSLSSNIKGSRQLKSVLGASDSDFKAQPRTLQAQPRMVAGRKRGRPAKTEKLEYVMVLGRSPDMIGLHFVP